MASAGRARLFPWSGVAARARSAGRAAVEGCCERLPPRSRYGVEKAQSSASAGQDKNDLMGEPSPGARCSVSSDDTTKDYTTPTSHKYST